MTSFSPPRPAATFSPSWPVIALCVVVGVVILALSSWARLPMYPVPMSLQTLAVLALAALLGPVTGTVTVLLWLLAGALGAPVLAGGASGSKYFLGPTAGFLFAFPVAAAWVGWQLRRGADPRYASVFLVMLAGHVICLLGGAAWLATAIGARRAWDVGVAPFLVGGVAKSILAALIFMAGRRWMLRR
jgi:biotin transport system substrate-specific component